MRIRLSHHDRVVPLSKCVKCSHELDAVTGVNHEHAPKLGNITLCGYCGQLYTFDQDLKLVATPEALIPFDEMEPDQVAALRAVRDVIIRRRPN